MRVGFFLLLITYVMLSVFCLLKIKKEKNIEHNGSGFTKFRFKGEQMKVFHFQFV